jgi:hypothetical protein
MGTGAPFGYKCLKLVHGTCAACVLVDDHSLSVLYSFLSMDIIPIDRYQAAMLSRNYTVMGPIPSNLRSSQHGVLYDPKGSGCITIRVDAV